MNTMAIRARAGLLLLGCSLLVSAPAAHAQRSEPPAMQGHDAEARMRDAQAEALHRRLFFDPARIEEGSPGVSCDHRVARRPETSAGTGEVVVAVRKTGGEVIVRLWFPPVVERSEEVIASRLATLSRAAGVDDVATLHVERHRFAWCR
jgi:hypothetical protein